MWNQALYKTVRDMGCIDESDHMTCSYSISSHNWKWTKNLFFHLLEFWTIFIPLTYCESKLSHWHFRLALARDLIQEGEGALTTDNPAGKTDPFHHPTDPTWQDKLNTDHQREEEFGVACVPWKTRKCGQISSVQNATWGCVLIPSSGHLSVTMLRKAECKT
jgi:hypothetical protein